MKATVLLADAAQTDNIGKVHVLGLGWTVTVTPSPPMAIVVLVDVEWSETNIKFPMRTELLDEDGVSVELDGPLGRQAVSATGEFEVGRPPGVPPGTPGRVPLAINIGPGISLVAGHRYEWRVTIGTDPGQSWSEGFLVGGTR